MSYPCQSVLVLLWWLWAPIFGFLSLIGLRDSSGWDPFKACEKWSSQGLPSRPPLPIRLLPLPLSFLSLLEAPAYTTATATTNSGQRCPDSAGQSCALASVTARVHTSACINSCRAVFNVLVFGFGRQDSTPKVQSGNCHCCYKHKTDGFQGFGSGLQHSSS